MWLWIDEFIGKGLDVWVILKFLGLLSITFIPIALPLGILFAAIMTFGSLGESSELVAVKSAGNSIARFSKPLFLFVILLATLSYMFNNYVITKAQLKASALIYDIQNKKPMIAIKAGSFFSAIPNHTIYVERKEADGKTVHGIKIYDHSTGRGNDKVTVADKGTIYTSDDKRFLIFELENGCRYEEKKSANQNETELIRLSFKYWKKVFDMSEFSKMPKTDESFFKDLRSAMTVEQISAQIDSTKKTIIRIRNNSKDLIANNIRILNLETDTIKRLNLISTASITDTQQFSFNSIPDTLKGKILSHTETIARNIKSMMESNKSTDKLINRGLVEHYIEIHRRFSLPTACVLLFIIGVALGAIIRKGGLGLPFIVAVIFFVIYYVLNTVGEKLAKENLMPLWLGMWMPSIILLLIGVVLIVKANNDSPVMNKEWYYRLWNKMRSIFQKKHASNESI